MKKLLETKIEENRNIKAQWNFWARLGIIVSILVGLGTLYYQYYENKRNQEEHRKKYPKIDVELAQQLFEQEKTFDELSSKEEITNNDIEHIMKKVVDLAKKRKCYLFSLW